MAYKRKTWAEKMNPAAKEKIERIEKDFADIPAGSSMLVATPAIVNEYVKSIPEGTATSIGQMRKDLAASFGAEYMCPVTAGIFLRIVAENAFEQLQQGKDVNEVAPFWRIIGLKSRTAKKLSFGTDFLLQQRSAEALPLQ